MTNADPTPGTRTAAVLGLGIMGAAMARNLVAAGLSTTVWNRSPGPARALADAGAEVATSPAGAVKGADVVITMLPDAAAVTSVVFDGGVVDALPPGAVWAQMGTIGIEHTRQLRDRLGRQRSDVLYVDAPVSGSRGPAESGSLVVLASGPAEAEPILGPVFAAVGRKTVWLGDVGQGSALKLVVNAYLAILVEGVAEMLALADHLGVEHARLTEAIGGGPLDAPLAMAKFNKMDEADYAPEFPLEWALKDVDLALDATADTGDAPLPALRALSERWHLGVDRGQGRMDLSAARLALEPGP